MTENRRRTPKQTNKWIGSRIARLRRIRGMTQRELGALIHRTDSTISDLENGYSDITLDHLLQIAKGLSVPIAALFLPEPGSSAISPDENFQPNLPSAVVALLTSDECLPLLTRILRELSSLEAENLAYLNRMLDAHRQRSSAA